VCPKNRVSIFTEDLMLQPARLPVEPWQSRGSDIYDASGRLLATTIEPADARRIVAAVNAVSGIPTDALEGWSGLAAPVHLKAVDGISEIPDEFREDAEDAIDRFIHDRRMCPDRRVTDRRRGERRRQDRDRAAARTG
jgi:hypothetical protein